MNAEILHKIWGRTLRDNALPYLAIIDPVSGEFKEREWRFYPDIEKYVLPGQNHFFTPLTFEGERKNENARGLSILFADMDNVREHKAQLDKLWPHILWMTSHENAQAVWFLSAEVPSYSAWADLNQRMTYYMGADKGGWHGSKLLRIPGTANHKYDPPQAGTVVSFQPGATPYEAEALLEALPSVKLAPVASMQHPAPISYDEWKPLIAKYWDRMPLITRSDLLRGSMRDRSEALVRACNKLRRVGVPNEAIFHILWWTEWNKFRTDRNRPDLLWEICSRE